MRLDPLKILSNQDTLLYRPELNQITGSVTATLLLQQVIYRWYGNNQKEFYKFKEPCSHKLYKEGDSWCEEVGFTSREFDTAIKKIGFKKGTPPKGQIPKSEDEALIIYYTDNSRVTKYMLNVHLLSESLIRIYYSITENTTYITDEQSVKEPTREEKVTDTPPNPEFDSYKQKKLSNKKRRALKKQYPTGIPPYIDIETAVVPGIKNVPSVTITQDYRDYCTFISKDRKSKFLPKVEGQNLWNELIRDGYTPDDIRYASVVAYRTDDFWKKGFYPEWFFRRTNKDGKAIDHVGRYLNKKADGDPDIMKIKMEQDHYKGHKYNPGCHICLEERDDELPNSTKAN